MASCTSHTTLDEPELGTEAELLMIYLDYVFPSFFPFYRPERAQGGRYWILYPLTSSRSTYYATLGLAARYWRVNRDSEFSKMNKDLSTNEECFKATALRELTVDVDSLPSKRSVEATMNVLLCIIQLLHLNSLDDRLEAWHTHLNTAISILQSHDLVLTDTDLASEQTGATYLRAFVIENIVWFSCFASMTPRSSMGMPSPTFEDTLWKLANLSSLISCEDISGCHDWVRNAFLEVISLENRRLQAEVDLDQLASRVIEIEENIERRISQHLLPAATFRGKLKYLEETADLDEGTDVREGEDLSQPKIYRWPETKQAWQQWQRRMVFCISYFFSAAVVIYLDAIFHNPDPNRPKIRHGVSRAILALSLLKAHDIRELTPHLLWPLYVLGCLAERSQQLTIYNILESGRNSRADPTLLLQFYDEISRNREAHLATNTEWTWAAMMASASNSVLLI